VFGNFISRYIKFASISFFLIPGCGKEESKLESLPIRVSVKESPVSALLDSESAAVSFKIDVSGCDSGYAGNGLSTSPIFLVKFDLNCVATLKEFSFGGVTYVGTLSGSAGTKAVFSGAGRQLSVTVASQLGSPLTDSDSIGFNFSQIDAGQNKNPDSPTYSSGHSVGISGVDSPNMEIDSIRLSALATGGMPSWEIRFDCKTNVVNANACPSVGNDPQEISKMDVKVIEDTYSGSLNLSQADALFETAGGSAVFVPIGTLPHGGMSGNYSGPGPVYLKRNLLVIIRYRSGGMSAYRYFNVDFSPI